MTQDNKYPNKIDRNWSQTNNDIFDFLKPHVKGRFLDVGCNMAILQRELKNGVGIDAMQSAVEECVADGLEVYFADANDPFPFEDNEFKTVVLSCVLQQLTNPINAIEESIRVCKRGGKVIGISPMPDTEQAQIGVHGGWIRSFTDPQLLVDNYGAKIEIYDTGRTAFFFEIPVRKNHAGNFALASRKRRPQPRKK